MQAAATTELCAHPAHADAAATTTCISNRGSRVSISKASTPIFSKLWFGFQVTTLLSRTYQLPANLRPRSTNSSAIPRVVRAFSVPPLMLPVTRKPRKSRCRFSEWPFVYSLLLEVRLWVRLYEIRFLFPPEFQGSTHAFQTNRNWFALPNFKPYLYVIYFQGLLFLIWLLKRKENSLWNIRWCIWFHLRYRFDTSL